MFIAKNEDLIILTKDTRAELEEALQFMVYTSIEETEENYILYNGEYKTETQITVLRQAEFENKFLTLDTNKNYRLEPKGYANAQQSIDTINNMVNVLGSLTEEIAAMILFYETPDFSKPEECTEEWLIQHQYSAEPMTKEEWQAFYVEFTTLYAQKRYQQALRGN